MREVQLVACVLEQIGQPFPAVGRLERDPGLLELAEQVEKRCRIVDDPARDQLASLLAEDGDLRALAVEVDTDVDHVGASFVPDFDLRPRHNASSTGAAAGPLLHDIKSSVVGIAQSGRVRRWWVASGAHLSIASWWEEMADWSSLRWRSSLRAVRRPGGRWR